MHRQWVVLAIVLVTLLGVCGLLSDRIRAVVHRPATPKVVYDDETLAHLIGNPLDDRAKTPCRLCSAHEEELLLGLQQWVGRVKKQRGVHGR